MMRQRILLDKQRFISWFFDKTTAPFAETKRQIEAGEHPFERDTVSEDTSEQPYVAEWMDADQAISLQGQLCLSLLQRSLREYLDQTFRLRMKKPFPGKGNWFENCKKQFLAEGVDLALSSVDLALVEELTLARDRIQHGTHQDSHSLVKRQDDNYRKRFPSGKFQSDLEARTFKNFGPKLRSIELTKAKLETTIEEIRKFSAFIEDSLPE